MATTSDASAAVASSQQLAPSAWMKHGIAKPENAVVLTIRKGGPGKSSLTLMLADAFVRLGLNVLVIDTDPQGNATLGLDSKVKMVEGGQDRFGKSFEVPDRFTVVDVIQNGEDGVLSEAVQIVDWGHDPQAPFVKGGPLRPGSLGVAGIVPCYEAIEGIAKQWSLGDLVKLKRALHNPATPGELAPNALWDVVLIDTPPGGTDIGRMAVHAANKALLLTTAEPFGMDAIGQTHRYLEDIRINYSHPDLQTIGLLLSSYNPRLRQTKAQLADFNQAQLSGHSVANVDLWPERIPGRTVVPESQSYRAPISAFLGEGQNVQAAKVLCQVAESVALRILDRIQHPMADQLHKEWQQAWPGELTPYATGGPS
ncbi:MAG: ParA family protein [Pseudomonas fluorescens]